jgi:hypothetical protein
MGAHGQGDIEMADAIASALVPGSDARSFNEAFDASMEARRIARRRVEELASGYDARHPARDYQQFAPTSVPSVPRAQSREEYLASPEYERARFANMGLYEPREPALTGPRPRR